MLTLLAAAQLYNKEISVGFARTTAIAPPLPIHEKATFKVSIFNGTKNATKILSDKCSWGYESLSFELQNPAGAVTKITRVPRPWYGNVPTGDTLESVSAQVRKIDFSDKTWQGFAPAIAGSVDGWKIRVILHAEPSKLFSDAGFWTGKIESGWTPARIGP